MKSIYRGPSEREEYERMMAGREQTGKGRGFCAKCGRRWGDHLTELALERYPNACRYEEKVYPLNPK